MSAPADTSSLASTPAPSAATSALAGSSPASTRDAGGASERPRIDPHTTWEQLRGRAEGKAEEKTVDTPRLTPDKLKAWLDEKKASEPDTDPEKGDAKAQTARATDDVQKIAAEATKAETPEPEAPKAPRTFKVKVKGEEIPVPIDKYAALVKLKPETVEWIAEHEGEHAAVQLYQRLHRGDEDARAHGTLKREMERMFAGLKSNPLDVLDYLASRDDVGFDQLDVAYQIVQRDIDLKAMTPEARRLREVEAQLQRMERAEQAREAERERVLREAHATAERNRVETYAQNVDVAVAAALADAKLPNDPYHRGLVLAELHADMARQGDAYRPAASAAEHRQRVDAHMPAIREKLRGVVKALYGSPDPETVQAFIADNPELHAAAAKQRVKDYKANRDAQVNGGRADTERGAAPAQKNWEAWRDDMRRRA